MWFVTGKKGVRWEWGWPYIFFAFLLINFGLAISLTEGFPSLAKYIILGDSPYEPIVKNLVVFFVGFILLVVGILKMITPIVALQETQRALQQSHAQLEKRVDERTAELTDANERLQLEVSDRMAAEAALRTARDNLENRVELRTAELTKSNEELLAEVSRRIEVERELRESEERYRSLVELLPIGVGIHSQGRIVFANRAGARILSAGSPDELMGKPVLDLLAPESQAVSSARIIQNDGRVDADARGGVEVRPDGRNGQGRRGTLNSNHAQR